MPIPQAHTARTQHGAVHFVRTGRGRPVLFLHQTPRSWREFEDVLPLLATQADCIAMAHAQGGILSITYGDTTFGKSLSSFYRSKSSSALESPFSRLLANLFVVGAFLLFVATFLAFAVARRSRYRESRSSKSRRLLDDDNTKRSRSVRRSKGSSAVGGEGDGLFRSPSSANRSKSRSKSKSRTTSSSARSRSKSYDAPKERSSTRTRSPKNTGSGDYF